MNDVNKPEPEGANRNHLDFEMLPHSYNDHEYEKSESNHFQVTCPDTIDNLLRATGLDLVLASRDPQEAVFLAAHSDTNSMMVFRDDDGIELWKVDRGAREEREALAAKLRQGMINILGAETCAIDS